jgi:hypothetical protein
MLRTKSLVTDFKDVPHTWIFESYLNLSERFESYLNLSERLSGQDVKIKSVFNPNDKSPSMFVYYSKTSNRYKFKDFSTDKQGDCIELVKDLFGISKRYDALLKIINDYNDFIAANDGVYKLAEFKEQEKYKVDSFTLRNWTDLDQKYWKQFNIGSQLLESFNISPLEKFTFKKAGEKLVIKGAWIYGYFRKDGSLYKIYQPKVKEKKFIKVKDYIQGVDQLKFDKPYLIICSSLKDAMAFTLMGFKNAEVIAPDSENTMIPAHIIETCKKKYKKVCTLFDNDEPGIKAMMKYKKEHNLDYIHLKLEKDLADCVATHGVSNTRVSLYPVITKVLTGVAKELEI